MSNIISNDKFLDNLEYKNIEYIPLEEYKGVNTCIDFKCTKNHIFKSRPRAIYAGQGCPYCSGTKVLIGFNDLWTTHPNIANLLLDKSIGYNVSANSHKKADFVCPNCNKILKDKTIKNIVTRNRLRCEYCFDGISYPEKFVSNMLKQLNVNYKYDCSFEWSNKKRYDFFIEDFSLIIESHGMQHYKDINKRTNYVEQAKNDAYKEQLAISNNIIHYIQLDCSVSSKEYIKNSILESDLSKIFNLDYINWDECDIKSSKSYLIDICDMWNDGIHNVSLLSDEFKLSRHTITNYLKQGSNLNICDYNADEEYKKKFIKMKNKNKKRVLRVDDNIIFDSVQEICDTYGYKHQSISACCRGVRKTAYGYRWKYIDE